MFTVKPGLKALPALLSLLAGSAGAQDGSPTLLPTLSVQGAAPREASGESYQVTRSSSATKTDTPLIDVP
ncbi:MAG: hypothetical protein ACK4Z4_16755, partial [Ferrovibrio sp.]